MAMTGGTAKLVKSGTPPTWPGPVNLYVYYKVTSQSIANNTSTLSLGMYITTPSEYWPIGSWTDWNGSYIGTATSGANCKTFDGGIPNNTAGTRWLIENQTVTVSHNSDGTKSVTIYWHWGVNSGWNGVMNNPSGSFTITLAAIPRAATITSAPNFNDEGNPTITYSNPAGNAVTSLQACISLTGSADDIVYRDISKTGTSYTFNLTTAERNILRNATTTSNSRSVRFYVKTVISGTSYLKYLSKTLTIVNANPTISPTIVDNNSTTIALTGDSSKFIRYYSNAKVTIGAAALKGATISSKKVTNSGKSLTADGAISGVTSASFVFTATDTRGNSASKTVDKTLVQYIKPTCVISNNKPDTSGNFIFRVSGNGFNGSFGAVNNNLTVYYRYKVSGGSYGKWSTIIPTFNGTIYSATASLTGFDYQTQYVFQAYAVDKLVTTPTDEKNIQAKPVFDWGPDDFNINGNFQLEGKGVVLRRNGENGNIVLSAPDAVDGVFIRPNGTGSSEGQTIFEKDGDVQISGNAYMKNGKGLYFANSSGADRLVVQLNSSNQAVFGYGGYSNNEGESYFDGNAVSIRSKGAIAITSPTAGLTARQYGVNKVLWSGTYYMTADHTATLSETVSAQPNGIVLVFSRYNSAALNEQFSSFFVPKENVAKYPGCGYDFKLGGIFNAGAKYVYIYNNKIVGHTQNNQTVTTAGVTYSNALFVLRHVYGV